MIFAKSLAVVALLAVSLAGLVSAAPGPQKWQRPDITDVTPFDVPRVYMCTGSHHDFSQRNRHGKSCDQQTFVADTCTQVLSGYENSISSFLPLDGDATVRCELHTSIGCTDRNPTVVDHGGIYENNGAFGDNTNSFKCYKQSTAW